MYHTNINNIIDSIQQLYAIEVIQIIEYFPCAHSLCSQTWLFKPNMSSMRHSVDIFTTQSLCRKKLNSILREIDVILGTFFGVLEFRDFTSISRKIELL